MFVSSISYWKSVSELLPSELLKLGKDFKLGTCKYMSKLKTTLLQVENSMFEFVCAITDLN